MSLNEYRRKRRFDRTSEPAGADAPPAGGLYVVQKHAASRLHYDFRLELGGVLKSWAVPKGPSLDPRVKVLAVHVEDHPLEYGSFEGTIPRGEYGGGTVMLWDRGSWEPEGDADESYRRGKLVFRLNGERLKGRWALIRMGGRAGQEGKNWLLKKLEDDEARPRDESDILARNTTSVATGRNMEQIAANAPAVKARAPRARRSRKSSAPEKPDRKVRHLSVGKDLDPAKLDGARRSAMPRRIVPELPLLVKKLRDGTPWLCEMKLDGYRIIGLVRNGRAALTTRRGNDWTDRFPVVAAALEQLAAADMIVDGEIMVLNPDGTSNFQALQNLMRSRHQEPVLFCVFDLLYFNGHDLRQVVLANRKRLLSRLLSRGRGQCVIRYNGHIKGPGSKVFAIACRQGLEGIVAKRADSLYVQRRSSDWVKVKCLKRQEFVVGGWTEPGGSREFLGALLVGCYRAPGKLVYRGRVGTGFTRLSLRQLRKTLEALEQKRSPFHNSPAGIAA